MHEKMETPLSDAQWFVPLGRATEASACAVREKMETQFSDAQWFVLLGRTTEASAGTVHEKMETPRSDAMVCVLLVPLFLRATEASRETLRFCSGIRLCFGSEPVSSRSAMRKHHFRLGTRGALPFFVSQNDRSVARNAPFLLSNAIFWFWSEHVSGICFSE